ncbi:hypothetical protein ACFL2C_02840 [Patescibacteria group bacterium]
MPEYIDDDNKAFLLNFLASTVRRATNAGMPYEEALAGIMNGVFTDSQLEDLRQEALVDRGRGALDLVKATYLTDKAKPQIPEPNTVTTGDNRLQLRPRVHRHTFQVHRSKQACFGVNERDPDKNKS